MNLLNKFTGAIIGSAIGDALGAATEFYTEEEIKDKFGKTVDEYYKARDFLEIGEITDDSRMMLAILDSFLSSKELNINEIAQNFIDWYNNDGRCCGGLCRKSILKIAKGFEPIKASEIVWENSGRKSAGNGGVMRNTPVPLMFCKDFDQLVDATDKICKITHFDPRCVLSCKAHSIAMYALLIDMDVEELISKHCLGIDVEFDELFKSAKENRITDFKLDGKNMGYTYIAIMVALCAIFNYDNFADPIIEIVNKGGDSDTNACVAGGLLGCKYGINAIPNNLVKGLYDYNELIDKTMSLYNIVYGK